MIMHWSAGRRPRHNQGSSAQAGYTIVEALLVLVVIGILLGTSLYPLGQRLRVDKIEQSQEQLKAIREAVLGYAYSNRTARAGIIHGGDIAVVPQGRPYLPCPDITGDGIEDRYPGNPSSYHIQSHATITNQFRPGSGTDDLDSPFRFSPELQLDFQLTIGFPADRADNPLLADSSAPAFVCVADRGLVPHTTLGTPPMDPWGNRFTYRVDPIFAHGVLGFGSESRSDVHDPRLPLTVTTSGGVSGVSLTVYQKRESGESFELQNITLSLAASTVTIDSANHNDMPGVVCLTVVDVNGCANIGSNTPASLYVNAITEVTVTVFDTSAQATVARLYDNAAGSFTSGLAFVVVSHGANAFGAVPHQEGRNSLHETGQSELNCLGNNTGLWPTTHAGPEDHNVDSISLCGQSYPSSLTAGSAPRTHVFVDLPVFSAGNAATQQFDDQVLYMSDLEVIQSMARLGVVLDRMYTPPRS